MQVDWTIIALLGVALLCPLMMFFGMRGRHTMDEGTTERAASNREQDKTPMR